MGFSIGALIIRIALEGILYSNYNKESPKPYSPIIKGRMLGFRGLGGLCEFLV